LGQKTRWHFSSVGECRGERTPAMFRGIKRIATKDFYLCVLPLFPLRRILSSPVALQELARHLLVFPKKAQL